MRGFIFASRGKIGEILVLQKTITHSKNVLVLLVWHIEAQELAHLWHLRVADVDQFAWDHALVLALTSGEWACFQWV